VAILRITAIVIALCACTALGQQPAQGTLTVTVEDDTSARFAGASITVKNKTTGACFETKADTNGQAVVQMIQGRYDLKVQAKGFKTWQEKDIEVKAEMHRDVTLVVQSNIDIITVDVNSLIPLEHRVLAAEIPLLPM
jgi:uncharacterized membrane protein